MLETKANIFRRALRTFGVFTAAWISVFWAASAHAVPITVEVDWTNWSLENQVIIRDPSNNILATICDPNGCNAGGGASSDNYSNTFNYDFPAGTNYSIQMDDTFGDGWNGASSFVEIRSGSTVILNDDGPATTTQTLNFNVPAAPPTGPQFCYGRPYQAMNFSSPVLISGTALQTGARYRYSNVITDTDAIVEITGFANGGSLNSFDTDTGLVNNFQPELISNGGSAVDFKFDFIDSATSAPKAFDFLAAGIDIDGNNNTANPLREYVEFDRSSNSYAINNPSELDIDASGPSSPLRRRFEARSLTTAPGIDPTAEENIAVAFYSFKTGFNYRFGSLEAGGGTRLTSLGFDCPNLSNPVFPVDPSYDYADAPASYGNPRHTIADGILLGTINNADSTGYNSPNADGDNSDDGIALPVLTQGQAATITADVSGAGGFLQGWVDWNGDGDFTDSGEQIANDVADGNNDGTVTVSVTPPTNATTLQTFARFRWSTSAGLDSIGNASNGEVEDYAMTVQASAGPTIVNCGTESQGTGSGYATSGTGIYRDKIFWFDWSCGSVTQFNPGDVINKSWLLPSGLTVTAQITNISAAIHPYNTGQWTGDTLDNMYAGVNPIGLSNQINGQDPSYDVTFTSIINGTSQKVNLVVSEAEDTSNTESATFTTDGLPWQPIEANGSLSAQFSNGDKTLFLSEPGNSGGGTLIALTESVSTVSVDMQAGGKEALAYGVIIEFDFGDAPTGYADTGGHYVPTGATGGSQPTTLTPISSMTMGTLSYGGDYRMGTNPTDTELGDIHSPNADGDDNTGSNDEDAATIPPLTQGQSATIPVVVNQPSPNTGHLQVWIDWNGDQDFDDPNEHVASGLQFGGGATGSLNVPVNVPSDAVTTQTIARFRWSSESSLNPTEIGSDGEIADFALTVSGANAELSANKSVAVYDPTNAGLYALPGNDVIYTISISNAGTGPVDTDTIELVDIMPDTIEFWNGDIDDGGPESFPVAFTQATGSGMSLTYGTDVRFGTGTTPPANFAACSTVPPSGTYRPDLTYICLNPKGALAAGDPDPAIELSFRARIK